VARTHDLTGILRIAAPAAFPEDQVADALTDVIHRTLFGLDPEVNVHPPGRRRPPALEFGPVLGPLLAADDHRPDLTPAGQRTLEALLDGGADVLVRRGFHGARVDDIVAAAGVSHGAFYRYFDNKEELARLLAVRAVRRMTTTLSAIPEPAASTDGSKDSALRLWLRRYNATQANEIGVLRAWVDAAGEDPALRADSAAAYDWGRRQLVRFLAPRRFGDVETDALIMVALLAAFGARERASVTVESAAEVIEHGLL
jgi:AcrR family transcriptional regulator